jgi:hypothetical protein
MERRSNSYILKHSYITLKHSVQFENFTHDKFKEKNTFVSLTSLLK